MHNKKAVVRKERKDGVKTKNVYEDPKGSIRKHHPHLQANATLLFAVDLAPWA